MNEIEAHKEAVSAMLDDELRAGDCERCTQLIEERVELRETWDTYVLIGDLLRGEPPGALSSEFGARLRAEPTVLAPHATARRRGMAKFAWPAAAAAAGIGFVTWIALGNLQLQSPNLEVAAVETPAAVGAAPVAAADGNLPSRAIDDYLLAHQPFSSTSAMQGVAPYVRLASDLQDSAKP